MNAPDAIVYVTMRSSDSAANSREAFCGNLEHGTGILVSSYRVITARHVVERFYANSGAFIRHDASGGTSFIQQVVVHPTLDLALVILGSPMQALPVTWLAGMPANNRFAATAEIRVWGYPEDSGGELLTCTVLPHEVLSVGFEASTGRATRAQLAMGAPDGCSGGPALLYFGNHVLCLGLVQLGGTGAATTVLVPSDQVIEFLAANNCSVPVCGPEVLGVANKRKIGRRVAMIACGAFAFVLVWACVSFRTHIAALLNSFEKGSTSTVATSIASKSSEDSERIEQLKTKYSQRLSELEQDFSRIRHYNPGQRMGHWIEQFSQNLQHVGKLISFGDAKGAEFELARLEEDARRITIMEQRRSEARMVQKRALEAEKQAVKDGAGRFRRKEMAAGGGIMTEAGERFSEGEFDEAISLWTRAVALFDGIDTEARRLHLTASGLEYTASPQSTETRHRNHETREACVAEAAKLIESFGGPMTAEARSILYKKVEIVEFIPKTGKEPDAIRAFVELPADVMAKLINLP